MGSRESLSEVKAEGRVMLLPELSLGPRLRLSGPERVPSKPCTHLSLIAPFL